eukprot:7378186-Prymnesium_polylepis.1
MTAPADVCASHVDTLGVQRFDAPPVDDATSCRVCAALWSPATPSTARGDRRVLSSGRRIAQPTPLRRGGRVGNRCAALERVAEALGCSEQVHHQFTAGRAQLGTRQEAAGSYRLRGAQPHAEPQVKRTTREMCQLRNSQRRPSIVRVTARAGGFQSDSFRRLQRAALCHLRERLAAGYLRRADVEQHSKAGGSAEPDAPVGGIAPRRAARACALVVRTKHAVHSRAERVGKHHSL